MQHDFSDDSDDSYVFALHKGHPVHSVYKELPSASVIVHGTAITALIDSGASVNLLDEQDFKALKKPPPLKRDTTIIKAYGIKEPLNTLGMLTTEVESTSKIACADFHMVHGNTGSILSYHTARELGLIHITNTIATSPSTAAELVHKYDHLFHGIGKIKDHAVKLYIIFINARKLKMNCSAYKILTSLKRWMAPLLWFRLSLLSPNQKIQKR